MFILFSPGNRYKVNGFMSLPKLEEARAGVVVRASEFPLEDRRVGGSRLDCKIPGHFKAVPLKN